MTSTPEVDQARKLRYPKQTFFIYANELLERFTFYAIRTIMVLFFADALGFSENRATVLFHIFIIISYFLPLIGAWIADSWLGKYKTILYISIIYTFGTVLLAISSIGSVLNLPYLGGIEISQRPICLVALMLIAIGTGGIKPCITPFGADQFQLPDQEKGLASFFSMFYLSINLGSVVATFAVPMIRSKVSCFGYKTCYPLAFSIAATTMITAMCVFFLGHKWYIVKATDQKIVNRCFACIGYGFWKSMKSREKKNHWLDHASDKYPVDLIEDTKTIVAVFKLISPSIVFWALNDKQSSRWTFQARRLDGQVTSWFRVEPDQMATVSSLLVLPVVPFFDRIFYPIMNKIGLLRTLLQRMTVGGYLMSLTFVLAGVLQLQMESHEKQSYRLSIAWQIPQYIVLVCAEIMFIISGTNFTYKQSPSRMESLVSSLWLLTVSLGNIVAATVAGLGIGNMAMEFFVDATIMVVFMSLFVFYAHLYKMRDCHNVIYCEKERSRISN